MGDYCTVADVKAQAAGKGGSSSDTILASLITAASAAIDAFCNRPDGFLAPASGTARLFAGNGRGFLYIDECAATPTLVEVKDSPTDDDYTAWESADWIAARGDPMRPAFNRTPYHLLLVAPGGSYSHFTSGRYSGRPGFRPDPDIGERCVPTVRVTARWGYATAVPATVKQACIVQVVQWFKRSEGAWADALQALELGEMPFRQELDPAVRLILVRGRLVRPAVG